jgi:hypothetical protein
MVGEITATTTGNTNFLCQLFGMIQQQHLASTLTRNSGTHHASGPGTEDHDVE